MAAMALLLDRVHTVQVDQLVQTPDDRSGNQAVRRLQQGAPGHLPRGGRTAPQTWPRAREQWLQERLPECTALEQVAAPRAQLLQKGVPGCTAPTQTWLPRDSP